MKALQIAGTLVLFTLLSACQGQSQQEDNKSSADSLNNMKDAVADPSKSVTKDLVIKVEKGDARFAVSAADGGLVEVELGNVTKLHAVNPKVKDFGVMINDHTKANNELKALASKKGISLPVGLSNVNEKLKSDLSSKSGNDYDKAYVKDMIEDHKEDIKAFQAAVAELKDQELKTFAVKTLPVLKKHLAAIEQIGREIGVK